MEFITNIDRSEFENFVQTHPTKSHFMQSYYFGEVSKFKNYKPYCVGVKKGRTLIATALVLEKEHKSGLKYMYIPRGFIMDYSDLELLKFLTKNIKKFAKSKNAFFVRIDPDIKLQDLDQDGNVVAGKDNFKLIHFLKRLGYHHNGFNKNFENSQPRYTFRLSLKQSMEDVTKNFHATTKKIIAKGINEAMTIYKGGSTEDYISFYRTMQDTAERENIKILSIDYYTNFHKILNEQSKSDLYLLKLNIPKLMELYKQKIIDLDHEYMELSYVKNRNKEKSQNLQNNIILQKEKIIRELENLGQIKQNEIVLSSIITVKYGNKVWTIHGGNLSILRELNANYLLYYKIIEDAHSEGYDIIDFFGTTGDTSSNVAGIHLFKKRFGGEYVEFIGEFDLVIDKFIYFVYTIILPRIKKK